MKFAVVPFAVNLFCVAVNFWLVDKTPHEKDEECRQQADPEQGAPSGVLRKHAEEPGGHDGRDAPADRPAALHATDRLATMLRAYHFAHQHGARGPFTAEAKPHQCAEDKKLRVILRKPAQKREECEPDDGNLQRAHAPETVGKGARKPAAECGA